MKYAYSLLIGFLAHQRHWYIILIIFSGFAGETLLVVFGHIFACLLFILDFFVSDPESEYKLDTLNKVFAISEIRESMISVKDTKTSNHSNFDL